VLCAGGKEASPKLPERARQCTVGAGAHASSVAAAAWCFLCSSVQKLFFIHTPACGPTTRPFSNTGNHKSKMRRPSRPRAISAASLVILLCVVFRIGQWHGAELECAKVKGHSSSGHSQPLDSEIPSNRVHSYTKPLRFAPEVLPMRLPFNESLATFPGRVIYSTRDIMRSEGLLRRLSVGLSSQNGEDALVLDRFFLNASKGVFLEMGALDGSLYSNTLFLQTHLGWTGVLIEAQPGNLARLFRHSRCHTGALCIGVAVAHSWGTANFVGSGPVAGIDATMFDSLAKGFNVNRAEFVEVPTAPLGVLLRMLGVNWIDYWSLDIEGGELAAIESFDWSIPVHVLQIEMADVSPQGRARYSRITQILRNEGFHVYGRHARDVFWVNPKNKRP